MSLPFAAFKRANRFRENALVGFRPEGIGAFRNHFKGQTAANDRLAQKEPNGTRHVEPGIGKEHLGLLSEVGVDTNL